MIRGGYGFGDPDECSPREDADFYLQTIHAQGGFASGDIPALDHEKGAGNTESWAWEWLTYVAAQVGVDPFYYTGDWYAGSHGIYTPRMARWRLWLADYSNSPVPPDPPGYWTSIAIWQRTGHAHVTGIVGEVDENVALVDLSVLGVP